MQPMMTYRATVPFKYGKGVLSKGEQFQAPQNIGEFFIKIGRAEAVQLVKPAMVDVEMPARAAKSEPLTERTPVYQTRHMEAAKATAKKPGRRPGKAKQSRS